MNSTQGPLGEGESRCPHVPIRALFLDDDRGVAEGMKAALAGVGIEVTSLTMTVAETVARAASDRPDLIVADIDIAGVLALGLPAALPSDAAPVLWWSGHDAQYRVPAAGQAGPASSASEMASTNSWPQFAAWRMGK